MNAATETAAPITITLPTLAPGEHWAGILFGKDGAPDQHIIKLPGDAEKNWDGASAWAKEQGGELPTRRELALVYANLPEQVERDWYWSCEQLADDPAFAWLQSFSDGSQDWDLKGDRFRVFAVRREPIR